LTTVHTNYPPQPYHPLRKGINTHSNRYSKQLGGVLH